MPDEKTFRSSTHREVFLCPNYFNGSKTMGYDDYIDVMPS